MDMALHVMQTQYKPTDDPFYWQGLILIPGLINNYIYYEVLIHSQISTVQPLKLGNG